MAWFNVSTVLISRLGSVWMSYSVAKTQKTMEDQRENFLHELLVTLCITCYKLHLVSKHIRLRVCLSWSRTFFMFILLCISSSLTHLWLFIGLLVLLCCLCDSLRPSSDELNLRPKSIMMNGRKLVHGPASKLVAFARPYAIVSQWVSEWAIGVGAHSICVSRVVTTIHLAFHPTIEWGETSN